ncbi:hypothetical protein [Victivallis vadensis]|uniref:Uncharacterized protein n=1 Tax=Victivallis vadensis TaxID=172901 RepID=A0A848AYV2_9BACT|nr:hypothetical protein [Victivallis vadensis]NMD87563.1 hypothetical protein [Victivallis vadensis]HJH02564.1 hypothetical protein [Victivallis vadensis]
MENEVKNALSVSGIRPASAESTMVIYGAGNGGKSALSGEKCGIIGCRHCFFVLL